VKFGHTEAYIDQSWYQVGFPIPFKGIPYDTPILGYRTNTIIPCAFGLLKTESFDFRAFNVGDYYGAVNSKVISENITKVLYLMMSKSQGSNYA